MVLAYSEQRKEHLQVNYCHIFTQELAHEWIKHIIPLVRYARKSTMQMIIKGSSVSVSDLWTLKVADETLMDFVLSVATPTFLFDLVSIEEL